MPSTHEADVRIVWVIARGLLYALAITVLVLWGPSDPQVFIYQNF